jgi:ParB-like chromosome segregation protein Spo0J
MVRSARPKGRPSSSNGDSRDEFTRNAHASKVRLDMLRPGPRLRMGDVNHDHVEALAISRETWPPIVVRRSDHSIVDGFYRYLAARRIGCVEIDCVFFDGDDEALLLEALRRNLLHGQPLSLRERASAARRLLRLRPDWSDRRLAEACGLAPNTVSRIRGDQADPTTAALRSNRRGRDGKQYPSDPRAARERILAELHAHPDASLRAIARLTGSSPNTVRLVKHQLQEGTVEDGSSVAERLPSNEVRSLDDSAFASTEQGREFAEWFERTNIDDDVLTFVAQIPVGRIYQVADEARRRGEQWLQLAATLEVRARVPKPHRHHARP